MSANVTASHAPHNLQRPLIDQCQGTDAAVEQNPSTHMRAVVRAELEAIVPFDALESEHLSDALDWVDSGAELFRVAQPATPPKHLVSYFAVVDSEHILLVDHKNAQLWLPAGGHVEPLEHPRATVER